MKSLVLFPFTILFFAYPATSLPGPFPNPLPLPLDFASEGLWERVVYNPPITSPQAGDVWKAGSEETVTWDASNIPDDITSLNGELLLGYLDPNSEGEHLMIDNPLATNFPLTDGSVTFTLPSNLTTRSTYIVVLMGDSGNASPQFTIEGVSSSGTATSNADLISKTNPLSIPTPPSSSSSETTEPFTTPTGTPTSNVSTTSSSSFLSTVSTALTTSRSTVTSSTTSSPASTTTTTRSSAKPNFALSDGIKVVGAILLGLGGFLIL